MNDRSWAPTASLSAIRRRAKLYADIRAFFSERGVLEVEVPLLGQYAVSDVHIDNPRVVSDGRSAWLQSSPEYFLKRLLVAYPLPCYSLGKAFRQGESGTRHHGEFSLLEWYRPGWDEQQLMGEVADLFFTLGVNRDIEVQSLSYGEAFISATGLNPHTAADECLREAAAELSGHPPVDYPRSACLDLIFSLSVEPSLSEGLVFIYDYPEVQAALARVDSNTEGQRVARRFEVFLGRLEMANAYWELTDVREQRRRFDQDNNERKALGKETRVLDEALLAALECGLSECAGVALGLDRLLMWLLGESDIAKVLSFCESLVQQSYPNQ